jgi:hypothetical protein
VVCGRDSNRSWNAEPTPNKSSDKRNEQPQEVGVGKDDIKHRVQSIKRGFRFTGEAILSMGFTQYLKPQDTNIVWQKSDRAF